MPSEIQWFQMYCCQPYYQESKYYIKDKNHIYKLIMVIQFKTGPHCCIYSTWRELKIRLRIKYILASFCIRANCCLADLFSSANLTASFLLPSISSISNHRKENYSKIYKCTLKWHYAQFSLQNLDCTCYIFQKIAINNDKWQIKYNDIF